MKNFLLALASTLIALEIVGFISPAYLPEIYDDSELGLARLQKDGARELVQINNTPGAIEPGWLPVPRTRQTSNNCLNEAVTYKYDDLGARDYPDYAPSEVETLLIGGSFVNGDELHALDTIASQMWKTQHIMAANLGVQGYDPVQAFVRVQRELPKYPKAKSVILGFTYEDLDRMVGSFRLVYSADASHLVGFKPYMKDAALVKNDPTIYDSGKTLTQAAKDAYKTDYWARPKSEFPYSVSLLRALAAPAMAKQVENLLTPSHQRFRLRFSNDYMSDNLLSFLTQFNEWAHENHVSPVVVFIPQNYGSDNSSAQEWIDANHDRLPKGLIVENLKLRPRDADKYTLRPGGKCHPSPYGAHFIAKTYTDILYELENPNEATPREEPEDGTSGEDPEETLN